MPPPSSHAVGDQVEVLFDGGIRRGGDVAKALALGAKAVLVGRAWLWGLAAGGERGVREVLEILRSGLDEALIGLGRSSIRDLRLTDLVIPPGFALRWPKGAVETFEGYDAGGPVSQETRDRVSAR